jgi:hypothetical protein
MTLVPYRVRILLVRRVRNFDPIGSEFRFDSALESSSFGSKWVECGGQSASARDRR